MQSREKKNKQIWVSKRECVKSRHLKATTILILQLGLFFEPEIWNKVLS